MSSRKSASAARMTSDEFAVAVAACLQSIEDTHGGACYVLLERSGVEGAGRLTMRAIFDTGVPHGASLTTKETILAVQREYPNSDANDPMAAVYNLLLRLDHLISSSAYRQLPLDG